MLRTDVLARLLLRRVGERQRCSTPHHHRRRGRGRRGSRAAPAGCAARQRRRRREVQRDPAESIRRQSAARPAWRAASRTQAKLLVVVRLGVALDARQRRARSTSRGAASFRRSGTRPARRSLQPSCRRSRRRGRLGTRGRRRSGCPSAGGSRCRPPLGQQQDPRLHRVAVHCVPHALAASKIGRHKDVRDAALTDVLEIKLEGLRQRWSARRWASAPDRQPPLRRRRRPVRGDVEAAVVFVDGAARELRQEVGREAALRRKEAAAPGAQARARRGGREAAHADERPEGVHLRGFGDVGRPVLRHKGRLVEAAACRRLSYVSSGDRSSTPSAPSTTSIW